MEEKINALLKEQKQTNELLFTIAGLLCFRFNQRDFGDNEYYQEELEALNKIKEIIKNRLIID